MTSPTSRVPASKTEDLVIDAKGLVKTFGKTRALDGFDLSVRQGEVHGFLGPNGAGKSTTIRALLGQLRLSDGRASIFGQDCWRQAVEIHRRLAYVPGDVALWDSLSGGECIDILIRLQGGADQKRRNELIEKFDLDPTKRTRTYSKGNRQKVALVAALSKNADLLLLDEPTSGLDPLMEDVFQQCILEARNQGSTVLLSSHILSEVERLCDRVTIIRRGVCVATGSLADLRSSTSTMVAAITERQPEGLKELRSLSGLDESQQDDGHHVRFHIGQDDLGGAMATLTPAGVRTLTVEPPSLNDLFLSAYEDDGEMPTSMSSGKGRA
ncbi:ATP-binding cassette domain-containing protein [Luteococcus sp.]|uniref:ABC transporter ATP-binding protein n=1 Tax=Luteococcus sp. TaxID=1969402 RepID=UPI003736F86C